MKSKVLPSLIYCLLVLSSAALVRADRDADRRNEIIPPGAVMTPPWHQAIKPFDSSSPIGNGYTPQQLRHAYGFDQLSTTGTGQIIAIVDAYGSPTIQTDLDTFCAAFNIPSTTVAVYYPQGTPGTDPGYPNWATETSLDVEWAHAIAPGATIALVISKSASGTDLFAAVDYAVSIGANQVSMSWGGPEFSTESTTDYHFNVPGVTFFASSGDSGAGVSNPASSPYVVSVGGTSLFLDSSFNVTSETAWLDSGGGLSVYEPIPSYQSGWLNGTQRGVPDVAYDADPNTGVPVYLTGAGWGQWGGTSMSAPQWAALFALTNSLRTQPISSAPGILYSLANANYAGYYRDIISGGNGGQSAGPGYDLVTGLGSPLSNQLVIALAGGFSSQVAAPVFSPPAGTYPSASVQNVAIVSATPGASIRYTTDGSTPSETVGMLYSGPVNVSSNTTLNAIAYESVLTDSSVTSGSYTFSPQATAPTFNPAAGTYPSAQTVTISTATASATIRYTTDGSTPSETIGTVYTGTPITISSTTTLNAIAYESGFIDSPVTSGFYTILPPVAAPVFSPAAGTYATTQTVIITSATSGASIRYTTDGSTPSETTGTLYSGPVSIGATTTLSAIAYVSGRVDSTVTIGTYYIAPPATAPVFSPGAGTYAGAQTVAITSATNGASILYTTDGSTPTPTNGTLYSGSVNVGSTTLLKAIAYESGLFAASPVTSDIYKISSSPATILNVLYNFTDSTDGEVPYGGLVLGSDGNFYGTTQGGGSGNDGTVFRMTPAGVLTTLASFSGANGANPEAAMVQGSDGNFYGTTYYGGSSSEGTVFKLTPTGILTTLVSFDGTNGSYPTAALAQGGDGNFYGATPSGGNSNQGTVFMMTPTGVLTTLVSFNGTNGANPYAGLVQGSDGSFYGTTVIGGSANDGTVFKMTPAGVLTTLVSFNNTSEAAFPYAGLVQGSDGNFYGMTLLNVFKMTPAGVLTTLASFNGANGVSPQAALVQGSDGNFYGATTYGGSNNDGTIFQLTPAGALTTLVSFNSIIGFYPTTALVQDSDGSLYGTTLWGGSSDCGVIFQIILPPPQVAAPVFSPLAGTYTSEQTVTISTTTNGASIRYTIDGSTPTETYGTLYAGPVNISTTTTLKAIAYESGFTDSAITSGIYILQAAAPAFSPTAGNYSSAQNVAIASATNGASIRYTTDGSIPTETNGTLYSALVKISTTTTIKAIAYKSGFADSAISSGIYTIKLPPTITSFTPTTIGEGMPVTITGTNLSGASSVKFNGLATSFVVNSNTQITATTPVLPLTNGPITVTTPGGTATSPTSFTFTQAPIITGFTPASGPVNRILVVNGYNFVGPNITLAGVLFNGVNDTTPFSVTNAKITLIVPAGATSGPITVQTSQGTATSTTGFIVAAGSPPANDNFANAQILTGASGSVSGNTANATKEPGEPNHAGNPGGASVWFAWTAPSSGLYLFNPLGSDFGVLLGIYTGTSVNALTQVSSGSPNGNQTATGLSLDDFPSFVNGTVLNAVAGTTYHIAIDGYNGLMGDYTLAWSPLAGPSIITFTPPTGYAGQTITILGNGFVPATAVMISGVPVSPANVTALSPTELQAVLPANVVTGRITVTTPAGTATSSTNFTVTAAPAPALTSFSPTSGNPGPSIRYTTDGSTPGETAGTLYSGPVSISSTTTLQAITYAGGYTDSLVASGTYTIGSQPQVAAPTFSPGGGIYTSTQSATITTATGGATIRYTTDGSTPSETNGTVYSGAVTIGSTTTLQAIAYESGFTDSTVTNATYTISASGGCVTATADGSWQDSPMTSSLSGTFTASFDATPSASPTNAVVGLSNGAQTAYSGNACSVRFNDLGTIDARNGGAYQAASVIPFSVGTTYHFRLDVNVTNHTYSIFVTPSGGSEIQVGSNYAFRNEQNAVTSLNYWDVFVDTLFNGGVGSVTACNFSTIAAPLQAGMPSFTPIPGTYSSAQSVSISTTTSGASISIVGTHLLGTTAVLFNGSSATFTVVSDTLVTAAVPSGATSGLISVITPSGTAVSTGIFTINLPPLAPVFSPAGGTFTSAQSVTITSSGATAIYYTTDGSTPTTSSTPYAAPITIANNTVLDAIGVNSGGTSPVGTATFTILPPAPVFSPAPGSYTNVTSFSVAISDAAGATIYYTTDGSTPTTASTQYAAAVSLPIGSTTLSAIAVTSSGSSDVATGTYVLTPPPPLTPVISPAGGTFTSAQSVTITSAGATAIYYTTDGSTPTTSSTLYAAPITIANNTVLQAMGVNGGGDSPVTSATFTILPPAPIFSPAPGTYANVTTFSVVISDAASATIYYTTDGSTPTTSSTQYTGAVVLPIGTTTLSAIAVTANGSGDVTTGTYVLTPPPPLGPVFSPTGGTFTSAQSVTIISYGATAIYYTTDGSTPTTSSTPYAVPITIANNTVLQAIGVNSGGTSPVGTATFTILPPAPVFSPAPGSYANVTTFSVVISDVASATIYYTTDGSTPTTSSTQYTGAVVLPIGPTTLSAIAATSNGSSDMTSGTYILTPPAPLAPVFNPAGGTFTSAQSVTITSSGATAIYYTTDGSTPTTFSTPYTVPISIANNTVLQAIGVNGGGNSAITSVMFTILPPAVAPRFSPIPGTYSTAQNVTMTSVTSGASIRYTTDDSVPTETHGTLYSGPVNISATTTLKAIAYESGFADSPVTSGIYTITRVAAPTFSPIAGTYTSAQNVTITSATSGASIRYTTDGTRPTKTHGVLYSGRVSISSTTRLKAIAYETGFTDSSVTRGRYRIEPPTADAPVFSPAPDTYLRPQMVTITSATGGVSIRYTTNGSTPTETHGTPYSSSVTIGKTTTLKAIAYEAGFNNSPVTTGKYTIH